MSEIESKKIIVQDLFSSLWFRIPVYQRPYVWSSDQINELMDDLVYAMDNKPDQQYFLGSFVFQSRKTGKEPDLEFDENDLLDGQQRMTTMMLLFACIRDFSDNEDVRDSCNSSIFQKGSKVKQIPERTRIIFQTRDEVQNFIDDYIKKEKGTEHSDIEKSVKDSKDRSIRNIARAVLEIRKYIEKYLNGEKLEEFITFLMNKVVLIYVATENLDDAFRLFTILNDRGVPLRNSDILKAQNLGVLSDDGKRSRYAELWEEAEGDLGDDFDRFLSHIRTILVRDKARMGLLDEYEQKIYGAKPPLLEKGETTFQFIEKYLNHYSELLQGSNFFSLNNSFEFKNLLKSMTVGLPSNDWVPPLLKYYDVFGQKKLLEFLKKLDNKFSADWICQLTPTSRIENMNNLIGEIESAGAPDDVLSSDKFLIDATAFKREVDSSVYGRRFTRYLLIKLDYFYADHSQPISLENLSVEHVLPQNPKSQSQWLVDFKDTDRKEWTDKLGNLVFITTRKNSSQGRLDYSDKVKNYFSKRITTCPNSLRVINDNPRWTLNELKANHEKVLGKIWAHYGV